MAYKALYRKYRPSDFASVKGQVHVVKTLMNALEKSKFSHAYLFTGPRGTGKTTIAKILAKTLNCEEYPTANACGVCDSCLSIDNASNPNIIEMDAASNNGVDDIRQIRENVKFVPNNSRFKVYIIDEVHMLSTGAFNALLKTLEEPPSHAIFILCTTEVHKIPATIISRTQRFDLKAIQVEDISKNIKEVVNNEGLKISKEAVAKISLYANGGMRDALSLLDQVIAYAKEEITIYDVNAVSGNVAEEDFFKLTNYLLKEDVSNALELVSELITEGKEVLKIINTYVIYLKDVLLYKNYIKSADYLEKIEGFKESVKLIDEAIIFHYIDIFSKALSEAKFSSSAKTYLDLAIIKSVNHKIQGESGFATRLTQIEEKLKDFNKISIKEERNVVNETTLEEKEEPIINFSLDKSVLEEYDKIYEKPKKQNLKKEVQVEEIVTKETNSDEDFENLFSTVNLENQEKIEEENETNLKKDESKVDFVDKFDKISVREILPFTYNYQNDIEKIKELEEKISLLKVEKIVNEEITNDVEILENKVEEIEVQEVNNNDIISPRVIEQVLQFAIENKTQSTQIKNYISAKWDQLSIEANVNIYSIVEMFTKGTVVATSNNYMIVAYENVEIVNQLMRKDIKDKLKNLFRRVYNNDLSYLALPEDLWLQKRKEFVNQLTSGIKEPHLSDINYEGLKILELKDQAKPSIISDAIDFVGEAKVIIE